MNTPTVSIVIPAFNHEKFISESLRSVAAQSLPAVEVIVIDDASSDATWETALSAAKDLSIPLVSRRHRVNRGLCATLNEGIQLAKGEFVCILASDDTIPVDKFRLQTEVLLRNPTYVGLYADMAIMGVDGVVFRVDRSVDRTIDVVPSGDLRELDFVETALGLSGGYVQSGLFRLDAVKAIGGFDERLRHEDLDFILRLLDFGRVGYQCLVGANYRVVPSGLNRRFLEFEHEYDVILEKHRLKIERAGVAWRKVVAANQLRRANNRLNTGARVGAAAWSVRAAMSDPLRFEHWKTTARALAPRFVRELIKQIQARLARSVSGP